MGMPKMKLAFPILAAVFAADIRQCKEVIKSTGTTAANLVSTISNVPCFTKTPGNNYPQKTCTTNGYSLYFQREGSGTTYFHAEHGCVEDLPKDFPTSDCTTSGTKCDIELTEENFGNYGTIKAEYQFGTAENNLGSITTNNPAVSDVFECYQCEGYEKDNDCYKTQRISNRLVMMLTLPAVFQLFRATPEKTLPEKKYCTRMLNEVAAQHHHFKPQILRGLTLLDKFHKILLQHHLFTSTAKFKQPCAQQKIVTRQLWILSLTRAFISLQLLFQPLF